jgi:hypothetical protein
MTFRPSWPILGRTLGQFYQAVMKRTIRIQVETREVVAILQGKSVTRDFCAQCGGTVETAAIAEASLSGILDRRDPDVLTLDITAFESARSEAAVWDKADRTPK